MSGIGIALAYVLGGLVFSTVVGVVVGTMLRRLDEAHPDRWERLDDAARWGDEDTLRGIWAATTACGEVPRCPGCSSPLCPDCRPSRRASPGL